jgi:hypothetical protein
VFDTRIVRRLGQVGLVVGVVSSAGGATGYAATAAAPTIAVVAQGLNNPRGLAWGSDGHLYVAEAGKGGTACVPGGPGGPGSSSCFGLSGSISRLVGGKVHRVVTGLLSVSGPGGVAATGPDGLSQREDGGLFTIITGAPQLLPPGLAPELIESLHAQAGQLLRVNPANGSYDAVAGVGAHDFAWASRHMSLVPSQFPDANPYGVLALEHATYVVDAASNTLDRVDSNGKVTVLAFFPNPPVSDAVPTCLAQRDGVLYVGELTGGGNAPGAAVVWRVVPGHQPVAWQTGFSAITGCGFGANGAFYVTEFQTGGLGAPSPAGDVIRIARDGTRTTLGAGQLFLPNGFLAGRDGSIYVSNWSIMPGTSTGGSPTGQVVRISG